MSFIKFGQPPQNGVIFEASAEGIAGVLSNHESSKALARAIDIAIKEQKSEAGSAIDVIRGHILSDAELQYAHYTTRLLSVTDRLRAGATLSKSDTKWVLGALEGKESPKEPAPEGRPKAKNGYVVVLFVELLRGAGFKPTRNPISGAVSGCDIVAHAFEIIGEKPTSYSGIKATYLKGRKRWPL